MVDLLNEMADRTFRKHQAFTIAELFNWRKEDLASYIGDEGCFSSIFDFAETVINASPNGWYDQKPVEPEQYNRRFLTCRRAWGMWAIWRISLKTTMNHAVSACYIPEGERSTEAKKMLGGLSFMLRGLPFLYQGQELGRKTRHLPISDRWMISAASTNIRWHSMPDARKNRRLRQSTAIRAIMRACHIRGAMRPTAASRRVSRG